MKRINTLPLLLLPAVLLLSVKGHTQVSQQWTRSYPGSPLDMKTDASGNVYIAGLTKSGGYNNYLTMKYNSAGTVLWAQQYNGTANTDDIANAVAIDRFGNVYVTGTSDGLPVNAGWFFNEDIVTVKYNSAGVQQWVARYDDPGNFIDQGFGITVDTAGNVYVVGSLGKSTSDGEDYITIKYNTNGVQQWSKTYNGPANGADRAYCIRTDLSGNLYISGYSKGIIRTISGPASTGNDVATIKYDTNGNQLWLQRYNSRSNGNDVPEDMEIDATGNVFICGGTPPVKGTTSSSDMLTLKYNTNGALQWARTYNGPANGYEYASGLAIDNSGNVFITGQSNNDYATVKYNSTGVQQWVSAYNGSNNSDVPADVSADQYGNVYVTGQSYGTSNADYATVKYNSSGVQQWVARYNGPVNGSDQGQLLGLYMPNSPIGTASNPVVYVSGNSDGAGMLTIKYTQPIVVFSRQNVSSKDKTTEQLLTSKVPQLSAGPNPVKSIIRISYQLPYDAHVSISVFDVAGREMARLVNTQNRAGVYGVTFNTTGLSKGNYICRMIAQTKNNEVKEASVILLVN